MEGVALRRPGGRIGQATANAPGPRAATRSGDKGPTPGAGSGDQISGTAAGDDALPRMAPAGLGVGIGPSGGRRPTRGRRTSGLRRDALDSGTSRGLAPPTLHRTEWRLG